jgi:hypothetical protein
MTLDRARAQFDAAVRLRRAARSEPTARPGLHRAERLLRAQLSEAALRLAAGAPKEAPE